MQSRAYTGLNLPGFLELTKDRWEASVIADLEAKDPAGKRDPQFELKSNLAKYGYGHLEDCASFAKHYKPAFEFLLNQGVVKDFEKFLHALREHLPKNQELREGYEDI